jgi:hypothetical protein
MEAMMRTFALVAGLGVLAVATAGIAGAAGETAGRYAMIPTDGGVIRLDTETGVMALCTRKAPDQWSCEDMKDSQHAAADEIERLKAENKALKDQVDQLEETLGLNDGAGGEPKPSAKLTLPSEADVDKAFDYLERMIGKLHERIEKFQERHAHGDGSAL